MEILFSRTNARCIKKGSFSPREKGRKRGYNLSEIMLYRSPAPRFALPNPPPEGEGAHILVLTGISAFPLPPEEGQSLPPRRQGVRG